MRILIILVLTLFIGQFITASTSAIWSDDENEYVIDLEEKEDGEKEVEKEIDEIIHQIPTLRTQSPVHSIENITRFLALGNEYQQVYLSTPYSPPDVIVSSFEQRFF